MSSDDRYQEIMRRLALKQQEQAAAPQQALFSGILDSLNAVGFLEAIKKRPPAPLKVYGPKTVASPRGEWVGVVVWHKPKGYYFYQTLGLLGIWAQVIEGAVQVMVGEKSLPFQGAIFNPESYYHHIRRRFDLYYPNDPDPPLQALYQASYHADQRLLVRQALEQALRQWVQSKLSHAPPG